MANVPKDDADRVRRNAPKYEETTIEADDEIRGFDLPPYPDPSIGWCKMTREWWAMWRSSPQGKLMTDSDWWSLLVGAMCHNEIWRPRVSPWTGINKPLGANGASVLMAELRRREDAFGATWEARQRMRLRIKSDQTDEEAQKDVDAAAKGAVDYMEKFLESFEKAKAKNAAELEASKEQ